MWYDIAVLGVLVYCMSRGASRGLIGQLAAIAGIILCLMFAETFSGIVGPHISLTPPYNEWVTMFGAYLFFSFLAFGAARVLTKGIENAGMKDYNAHLGAVFGLAKGAVICLVVTFFVATLPAAHDVIRNSRSGYYAALTMQKLHPIMPDKLHDSLEKYIHSLDDIPGVDPFHHGSGTDPHDGIADAFRESSHALDDRLSIPSSNYSSPPPVSTVPGFQQSQPFQQSPQTAPPPIANNAPANNNPAVDYWGRPIKNTTSTPVQTAPATARPVTAPADPTLQQAPAPDFWAQVRGAFGTQARNALTESLSKMDPATQQAVQQQILQSLQNTRSEDLPSLERQIISKGVSALPSLIQNWNSSTPSATTSSTTAERERLLNEVVQLRSGFPQVQSRLQAEIRGLMSGIPDRVAISILQDWKADLQYDRNNDPDRSTDINTTLEQRILLHLQRSGMRIEQLDTELQQRLSAGAAAGTQLR